MRVCGRETEEIERESVCVRVCSRETEREIERECVCVCVVERQREREIERERPDRQTNRENDIVRESS